MSESCAHLFARAARMQQQEHVSARSWSAPGGSIAILEPRPRVTVVRFVGAPSLSDFEAYLDELTRRLSRDVRGVTILDLTASSGTSMDATRAQARWIAKHRAVLRRVSAGTIFVFPSSVFQFALATLLTVTALPGGYRVVASTEEALIAAEQLLAVVPRL